MKQYRGGWAIMLAAAPPRLPVSSERVNAYRQLKHTTTNASKIISACFEQLPKLRTAMRRLLFCDFSSKVASICRLRQFIIRVLKRTVTKTTHFSLSSSLISVARYREHSCNKLNN